MQFDCTKTSDFLLSCYFEKLTPKATLYLNEHPIFPSLCQTSHLLTVLHVTLYILINPTEQSGFYNQIRQFALCTVQYATKCNFPAANEPTTYKARSSLILHHGKCKYFPDKRKINFLISNSCRPNCALISATTNSLRWFRATICMEE